MSLFTRSQEKAQSFLSHENKVSRSDYIALLSNLILFILQGMDDDSCQSSTPKAVTSTPLSKNAPVQGASPGGVNVRTPKMIQFGKFDISTWYSSPYPQVNKFYL